MKWNILIGALVLSLGLAGQSFGAGLLSKVLGCAGSCDCCDAEPSCGCGILPKCGCCFPLLKLNFLNLGGCCASSCCDEPSCGCEPTCEAEPSCGCATSCCTPCCGGLLQSLLDSLSSIGCGCTSSCCDAPCGCDDGDGDAAPADVGEASDAAPMPPAPIVDPSAFVPSKRRVIPASVVR